LALLFENAFLLHQIVNDGLLASINPADKNDCEETEDIGVAHKLAAYRGRDPRDTIWRDPICVPYRLAAIREQRPDFVVLDIMMPERNGYEICAAVRADPDLAGVRILMLTAKGREADFEKGFALGADAYMAKPFSTRAFVEKVRALLEG
jgi:CheY-like chemotaxis protein